MIIIKGKSASSGVAVAPIAAKPDASDEDRVTLLTSLNPEAELRRFHAAQEKVIAQLGELAEKARQEIGEEEAGDTAVFDDVPGRSDDHGRDAVRFEMSGDQTHGLVADGSKRAEKRGIGAVDPQSRQHFRRIFGQGLALAVLGRHAMEA